jgi:DNA-3-methyladenine glycosylase
MTSILKKSFYQKNTLQVARSLLGCVLVRKIGRKIIKAVITETEAYKGEDDLASHASRGRTPRTELMYGEAGRAYVYMIYGMYFMLNVVTEKKNFPAAVLIRSVAVFAENTIKINGPGKVCKFLQIDKKFNGYDLTLGKELWIEKSTEKISQKSIVDGKRVGVDYAKHCKEYLWRFSLVDDNQKKQK